MSIKKTEHAYSGLLTLEKDDIKGDFNLKGQLAIKANKPTYREVKDANGNIVDYLDVRIEGYANTFNLDRGGEQTIPGSFNEFLAEYLSNPILLTDHTRDTKSAAGIIEWAYEDNIGIKVAALLSNSPSENMRDLRFKVVERVLRTFSIGGRFHGKSMQDRIILYKVEWRETSIVTVPLNKESLFKVKALPDNQSSQKQTSENMRFDFVDEDQENVKSSNKYHIKIDNDVYQLIP